MARRGGLTKQQQKLLLALGSALVGLVYHWLGGPVPDFIDRGPGAPSARYEQAAPSLQPFSGQVVAVHDGDTVTVLDGDKTQHKIRLAEMDAPELKQPYGQTAKQALSALVFNKTVDVRPEQTDRYGRTVAHLFVADSGKRGGSAGGGAVSDTEIDVNRQMVAGGNAWVYRAYLHDKSLIAVEDQARAQQRGLWALQADQREAPWQFRKELRDERAAGAVAKP